MLNSLGPGVGKVKQAEQQSHDWVGWADEREVRALGGSEASVDGAVACFDRDRLIARLYLEGDRL